MELISLESLESSAEEAYQKLKDYDGSIRIVGQYDADGISATTIAVELLEKLGKDFSYEILDQLYDKKVEELTKVDEDLIFFVDIGSGKASLIEEKLSGEKDVIVSDHHEPKEEGSFVHVNPHFNGLDGGESISAAGVTYLIADSENSNTELVKYALIGATGDIQKQDGEFLGLNENLEQRGLQEGVVDKKTGLSLYGRSTRPLHKALMYTTDPYLEGITNNESGAINFLKSLNIELRENGSFRTLSDLSQREEQQIIEGLLKRGYPADQLLQNIHILDNGKGIDEFSTIINACGRLGEPKTGVKILREDDLDTAKSISRRYGRKISSALSKVEKNADNPDFVHEDNIGLIDAGSQISKEFIGPVTTISMSNGFFDSSVVVGAANTDEKKVKFSVRATKDIVENGLNLGEVVGEICENLDAEGGGHNIAAGAKISLNKKEEFLNQLKSKIPS